MREILHHLLADPPEVGIADSLEQWWPCYRELRGSWSAPIDRALAGGFAADRVGYAFAAGYDSALRAMVPSLDCDGVVVFCATEEEGNHPRAIRTALVRDEDGRASLSGHKRWTTGGPLAERMLVVASEGSDDAGRNRLRVVGVAASAPGVTVTPMPPTPFTPEIAHAEVTFEDVAVDDRDMLEGDGYEDYLKPFRTVEDLHVHAAVIGYVVGVARRHDWPHPWLEQASTCIAALRTLALEDPKAPEVHVAVAGVLAQGGRLIDDSAELWATLDGAERERWERDQGLLQIAGKARTARRERAWQRLAG